MRFSQLLGKTLRQVSAEADTPSHQLMLRAGLIYQVAAGIYSYLPTGWRALRKVESVIREEMDRAGGQELMMPVLQPCELWDQSGRRRPFGQTLFTLKDRRERVLCLGPTHEEVVTDIVAHQVKSYRDLPLYLYQIQVKFRDEPRPRGGLLRVREFHMKDMYSFHTDEASLDEGYWTVARAYERIFSRLGLSTLMVEADSGAIGGKASHEFMALGEAGEDEVVRCEQCNYAANMEKAESRKTPGEKGEPLPVEEVSTPGKKSIDEVAGFLGLTPRHTLKAIFYIADGKLVFVLIRGDQEVNEVKLKNLLRCAELRLSGDEEIRAAGLVPGFASPAGIKGVTIVADHSITSGANFVAGANKPDTHLKNVNYPRDFQVEKMADIARARPGEGCPKCGHPLTIARGIEVGHIFKLGTFLSEKMGASFLDKAGASRPIIMGCYGIGVGRLLAAVIELTHDDRGIIWPASIAPYQVYLCALMMEKADVLATAEKVYNELQAEGLEVLFDDRQESPGVKFNDADLLGMPLRVTVSPRTLEKGSAEVKLRQQKETRLLPLDGLASQVKQILTVA
ncbi:MAG: proline--tRNA ligase [Dehalococcoidia bacterium]|nr:proline--tRNA ligase [Dehalococcoidia bacterium]